MPWGDWHFWEGWLVGASFQAFTVYAIWRHRRRGKKTASLICLSMEKIKRNADAVNARSK